MLMALNLREISLNKGQKFTVTLAFISNLALGYRFFLLNASKHKNYTIVQLLLQ